MAAVLLVGLAGLTACDLLAPVDEPAAAPSAPTAAPPASAERARELLAGLPLVDRRPSVAAYERDAFGEAWADTDGNGCNQRDDVLLRDAVPGSTTLARQGACGHDVLAGTWADPYTGKTLVFDDLKDPRQAQALQIDHVVPLAEAWISGAWDWPDARRELFANDLRGLLAVDGPTNSAKGADDPAAWRPRQAYQCDYARRWITVKDVWDLAADASEVAALGEMLAAC